MKFPKSLSLLLAAVLLTVSLGSCGSKDETASPSPSAEPERYYNGAYGIEVTVLDGWTVASINTTNMTQSADQSSDPAALDITAYEDAGSGMQMIELWNREDSADREHASLMLYIELYDSVDETTYLEAFQEAYAGDFDGYFSTFESKEAKELGGETYTMLKFSTTLPDSEDIYYEEYYIRTLREGVYLIVSTTYWKDNLISQDAAAASLTCFNVTASESKSGT